MMVLPVFAKASCVQFYELYLVSIRWYRLLVCLLELLNGILVYSRVDYVYFHQVKTTASLLAMFLLPNPKFMHINAVNNLARLLMYMRTGTSEHSLIAYLPTPQALAPFT